MIFLVEQYVVLASNERITRKLIGQLHFFEKADGYLSLLRVADQLFFTKFRPNSLEFYRNMTKNY